MLARVMEVWLTRSVGKENGERNVSFAARSWLETGAFGYVCFLPDLYNLAYGLYKHLLICLFIIII
jgi:hypothetical protein